MTEEPRAWDTAAGSRVGSRFGHYLLRRLLGRGGFGEVYEAQDTVMDRAVALKLLAAPYSQNRVFRERLHREARAAGRLHEPHVVPIHQCGEIDGQLYIDMRLIEGTDLQSVLTRDGPLSPPRAVAIVRQIAAALDAAHSAQMVHRDVKPANILLTGDDFACLVDFGLATAATDAKLTSSGTTIGTFAYMAPERLNNTEVSHRADIYALACVLYECLTGSPPYAIGDLHALIAAHLTAPIPRPSQHRPQIPAAFDDIIARGMAKAAKDRYAEAGELARAAHRALTAPDQGDADTILARTQAAATGDRAQTPGAGKPPASSQTSTQAAGQQASFEVLGHIFDRFFDKPRTESPTKTRRPATKPAAVQRRGGRKAITLAAVGPILVALLVLGYWLSQPSAPLQRAVPSSQPSLTIPNPHTTQVELPFTGLRNPGAVAVDTAGNVYITDDRNTRVLKLPAGSNIQIELPFTGLNSVDGVAVDSARNVYITDGLSNGRVLKLPTGSNTPVELPFTGLKYPYGVAVDSAGNVYVTDATNTWVLKLPAGSNIQIELPFTGLNSVSSVAVDSAGNVYVIDRARVLKLPAGSSTPVELPFTGLHAEAKEGRGPTGVAVDSAGNVYITDDFNNRVVKLPTGSNTPVELPFTGLNLPTDVTVDSAGNVYVVDSGNYRVLKLPVG